MKRIRIVPAIAIAMLFVGTAAVASAQDHRCSNPGLTGAWGYTETGTVVPPAASGQPPVLAVAVGRYDFDAAGNFSGTQYSSAAGAVSEDSKVGSYVLNPDCTGTLTIRIYDASGTTLRRTSVWAVVLVDNATEFRGIMISMALPNGVPLSPIMTISGKRLFRDRGEPQ
jgi:hypothetical protein